MTDYNLDLALGSSSPPLETQEDEGILIAPSRPWDSRDLQHLQMEALSLKRYHASRQLLAVDDLQQGESGENASYTGFSSPLSSSSESLENDMSIASSAIPLLKTSDTPQTAGFSITSPLLSLKVLGTEIERSNGVLQSCLQRAALPNNYLNSTEVQSAWNWTRSVVVAAPVVLGLFVDSLLG